MGKVKSKVILRPSTISLHSSSLSKEKKTGVVSRTKTGQLSSRMEEKGDLSEFERGNLLGFTGIPPHSEGIFYQASGHV